MNVVTIMGRLTADPEVKQSQSGIYVCRFTVAVDRYSKSEDKKTDFIRCVAFRQTAEFLGRYFMKGKMIAVSGSINTDSYTDKNGEKRDYTQVVADRVYFCGDKQNPVKQQQNSNSNSGGAFNPDDFAEILSDGDVPF